MYILYGKVQLFLPNSSSLKDKRQTIKSIISRIRKRFNISICEANYHDLWQRSELGFAAACNAYADADPMLEAINKTIDYYADVCEVTEIDWQIITD
jgi:hypothetical protein